MKHVNIFIVTKCNTYLSVVELNVMLHKFHKEVFNMEKKLKLNSIELHHHYRSTCIA